MDELIKMWYIFEMEYYSVIKKKILSYKKEENSFYDNIDRP